MKIVYLILIFSAAVFHVLYKGDLSFVLLAFLLALPVVLYAALAVGSAFLRITVYCDSSVTEREKPASVKINIRNGFFFPVSSCEIKARYSVSAPFEDGTPVTHTAAVPLGGRASETLSLNFLPNHCGTVSIRIGYARLHDLMGIASLRKKIDFRTEITVLPRVFPIDAAVKNDSVYSAESNSFSKEKPGDDPSEIFMLREYRDGDRNNLIHWKLSSRSGNGGNLIVRELSKPVGSKILLIPDLGGCKTAVAADRILETAAAVSGFLAENGIVHSVAVFCSDCTFKAAEITGMDSFYSELAAISQEIKRLEYESSAAYIMEISDGTYIANNGFSRVIAVSERNGGVCADELAALCGEARLTVICTSPEPETNRGEIISSADFIYADAEKLSSGKADLVI